MGRYLAAPRAEDSAWRGQGIALRNSHNKGIFEGKMVLMWRVEDKTPENDP